MRSLPVLAIVLISLSILLTGCPVSTTAPLQERQKADIFNTKLLGTWSNTTKDAESSKVSIEKGADERSAILMVEEKGSMYMAGSDKFDVWSATLKGMTFMILKEISDSTKETYYVYHYELKDGNLITHDVSLKVKGIDAAKEPETFQEEVIASMKEKDFLSSEIIWTKE